VAGKHITLKDIHNLGRKLHEQKDLPCLEESLKDSIGENIHHTFGAVNVISWFTVCGQYSVVFFIIYCIY